MSLDFYLQKARPANLFSGVEYLGLQVHDLLLRQGSLPRDLRVLPVQGVGSIPLLPKRLHGLTGPAGQRLDGVSGERHLILF